MYIYIRGAHKQNKKKREIHRQLLNHPTKEFVLSFFFLCNEWFQANEYLDNY